MPANPNAGTGYVDWSGYVNANQGNVAQDRSQVSNYLMGEASQLQNMDPNNPQFGALQTNLGNGVNALGDPSGFQQVLAQAKANYDPTNPNAKYSSAAADPFSAALEGQNAGGLYTGPDPYGIKGQAPAAPAPAKDPGGNSGGPPSPTGNEGPPEVGKQHGQDNGPNWGEIVKNPQDYPGMRPNSFQPKPKPPPQAPPSQFPTAGPKVPRKGI